LGGLNGTLGMTLLPCYESLAATFLSTPTKKNPHCAPHIPRKTWLIIIKAFFEKQAITLLLSYAGAVEGFENNSRIESSTHAPLRLVVSM
jgi:hypothetical protein